MERFGGLGEKPFPALEVNAYNVNIDLEIKVPNERSVAKQRSPYILHTKGLQEYFLLFAIALTIFPVYCKLVKK